MKCKKCGTELGQKNICPVCSPAQRKASSDVNGDAVSDDELEKTVLFLLRCRDSWDTEFDSFYDELKPAAEYEDFYDICRKGVEILSALGEILSDAETLTGELVIKVRETIPARFPSVSADRARQLARIVFSAAKGSKIQPAEKKAAAKAASAPASGLEAVLEMPEARIRLALLLVGRVESLNLSGYTLGILKEKNIDKIYELCTKTESQLMKECGFGAKALSSIEEALRKKGLRWGMTFDPEFSEAIQTALGNVDRIRRALLLAGRVESLNLSGYPLGLLKGANIDNIYELCTRTEPQLKECGFDSRTLSLIEDVLRKKGLQLGMTFDPEFSRAVEILLDNVARAEYEKRNLQTKIRNIRLDIFYSLLKLCALEAGTIKTDTNISDDMRLHSLFPQDRDKEKLSRCMNRSFPTEDGLWLTVSSDNYFSVSSSNYFSAGGLILTVSDLKEHLCNHARLDAEDLSD